MPAGASSRSSGRVVRFLAGGVVTYTIALILMAFWIGVAEVPRAMAYALTHATALGLAFVLNRRWVFAATAGNVAVQGAWFVVAQVGFRMFDWSVFTTIDLLLSPPVAACVLAANLIVLPVKYVVYRDRVFAAPAGSSAA